jgi:hypothetical protein
VVVPEPGVYVYASRGFDSVDALTGARHDYPAQTTVTVTTEGCGVRVRWNTVRERWDEWFIDRWLRPRAGLVLREVSGTDTDQSTALGKVRYQEGYAMALTSLTPQR